MAEYLVIWRMHVDASDPTNAAQQAREAVIRPDSIATVYDVAPIMADGAPDMLAVVEVDLSDDGQDRS